MKYLNKTYITLALVSLIIFFGIIALVFKPRDSVSKTITTSQKNIKKDIKQSKNLFVRYMSIFSKHLNKFINYLVNTKTKKAITYSVISLTALFLLGFIFKEFSYIDFFVFNLYNKLYLDRITKDLAKISILFSENKTLPVERAMKIKNRLDSYSNKLVNILRVSENSEIKQITLNLISSVNKLLLNNCYTQTA